LGKSLEKQPEPWEGLGERLKRAVASVYATTGEKITPADLGAAVERSEGTISLWQNGESYPSIEQAYKLAARLGISAAWLVYNEGVMLAGNHPPARPMPPGQKVDVPRRKLK
jgi:transcriptional regulator with XRE-family HTH domain